MKEVFMVQGSYGRFGLTAAMFRRCKEFLNKDIQPISLTLDFTDNIYSIVDEFLEVGKIDNNVILRNPYIELSELAINWGVKLTKEERESFLLVKASESSTTYYYSDGQNYDVKNSEIKRLKSTEKKFNKGVLISEVIFRDNIKYQEKFYSKNGFCIAIREWGSDLKQKRLLTFDYSLGVVREYKNSYFWNVEWLKCNIFNSFLMHKMKPLLICDGPGTARKITEISKDIAIRLYVVHHNHKNLDNTFTSRDLWNLKNGHKFDAIISLTQQHAEDLKKDYPSLSNIITIPNFTNISVVNNISYNYKKNRVGFFGQLIDRKGVSDAIKVIGILKDKYSIDLDLDIYGVSPINTEKAIEQYSKVSLEYGVDHLVKFHRYSNNVSNEMQKCLCVIFPSNSEAQPLTILESLSVGTPVVAYDCKYGPGAMIINGNDGYLNKIGDLEGLASNIYKLFSNENLRERMSEAAIASAKELTSKDKIYSMWQQLFFL